MNGVYNYQLSCHPSDILLGLQRIAYTILSSFLRLYKLGVVGVVTLIFGKQMWKWG
jgi:hypothetical protein